MASVNLRRDIIYALRSTRSESARKQLLAILGTYLRKGPRSPKLHEDPEYMTVVFTATSALQQWPLDAAVQSLLGTLATDRRLQGRIDSTVQIEAHKGLLLAEMQRRGLAKQDDKVRFLLGQLQGSVIPARDDYLAPGFLTIRASRDSAIRDLIVSQKPPTRQLLMTRLHSQAPGDIEHRADLVVMLRMIDAASTARH